MCGVSVLCAQVSLCYQFYTVFQYCRVLDVAGDYKTTEFRKLFPLCFCEQSARITTSDEYVSRIHAPHTSFRNIIRFYTIDIDMFSYDNGIISFDTAVTTTIDMDIL